MARPKIGFKEIINKNGKFVWDGQPKRAPNKGEYYLSGALPTAFLAPDDLHTEFFIMKKAD